jgi:hypothetical protein
MARDFAGSPKKIRDYSSQFVTGTLDLNTKSWSEDQRRALENLSLVFAMIPNISRWNSAERALAAGIIRAKAGADEALYLNLMQRRATIRDALIRFGSE